MLKQHSLGHKRRPGNTNCVCRSTQSAANSVEQRTSSSRISGILAVSTFQQAFLNRGVKALQVDFLPPFLLTLTVTVRNQKTGKTARLQVRDLSLPADIHPKFAFPQDAVESNLLFLIYFYWKEPQKLLSKDDQHNQCPKTQDVACIFTAIATNKEI